MSVVRVDLPLPANESEAAFRNRTDPAMHPETVGLVFNSPLAASCWAQAVNTATLVMRENHFKRYHVYIRHKNLQDLYITMDVINIRDIYLPESMSPWPPQRLGEPKTLTALTVMFHHKRNQNWSDCGMEFRNFKRHWIS